MMDKNDLLKQRKIVDMFKAKAAKIQKAAEQPALPLVNGNGASEPEEQLSEEALIDQVGCE